jgi:endogenous inhibitor of DNA gyrase (YacG/DUF329 family)
MDMTIREAMDTINGALDSLYEFYADCDCDVDKVFEDIVKAESILEMLVAKEEERPKEYWAVCPDCGHELLYSKFEYSDYYEDITTFLASGYCPHCQKDFAWKENFELVNFEFDN